MFTVDGKRVKFFHGELAQESVELYFGVRLPPNPKNKLIRTTLCIIEDDTTRITVSEGVSICSVKDMFSRNVGRKKALADALKHIPKDKRVEYWREYFNTVSEKNRVTV